MAASVGESNRASMPYVRPHPLLFHSLLLGERLHLFARLRLWAAASIVIGAEFADKVVGIEGLSLSGLAASAVFLAAYGAVVLLVTRPYRGRDRAERRYTHLVRIAHTTIFLDYLVLTWVIWLVGGAESPFRAFYLIHAIVASILLTRRAAFAHAAVGWLLLSGLVIGEWTGWLPRQRPIGAVPRTSDMDVRVVLTILFVYGLLTGVTTYLMTGIARLLRDGERRLRDASDDLDRLANLRRAFLHIALHDLRSPVGTVVTLLDNLQAGLAGGLNETQGRWVSRAESRLRGLLVLLRDMQTLADLETGEIEKLMVDVDVVALVRSAVEDHADSARDRGIALATDLPKHPLIARAVERLLAEAIANYLTNAVKYTQPGGHVVVRACTSDSRVRIEVRDDGPGISTADQSRLFREFVRLSQARGDKAVPGTGLGLSIVRRIAEAHGGTAGVVSDAGKGSTFFVEIPRVPTPRP